ncbi:MAG: TonB-dependent receptor [Bacteroidales bacterium]|nr:TonB-dependent receptor [Bacteroidales bacterium]
MKHIFIGFFLLCLSHPIFSQTLSGTVLEYDAKARNKTNPLPFANVYWLKTLKGTTTDDFGKFTLEQTPADGNRLVVSYVGYASDTIDIKPSDNNITIILSENIMLDEVQIIQRQQGAYISRLTSLKTEVITSVGLCQLACCDLAESFENSATVDVGYADAISGAKQIQMLGLAGLHSQIMYENMPFLRGLSAPYGLSYVPGSFMESIQIAKGTSTVINGFEGLAGQINLEYRKPQTADPLFVNLFYNTEHKMEANVIANARINDRLGTTTFVHGSMLNHEMDHVGNDGFMDHPKYKKLNIVNRWSYDGDNYRNISTFMFLVDDKTGGQMGFNPKTNSYNQGVWGFTNRTNRAQAFIKNGFVIDEKSNIGTQLSGTYTDMKAMYGIKKYDAVEKNFYANMIYENAFTETNKLNAGVSFQYNNIEEYYNPGFGSDATDYIGRTFSIFENVPGIFSQYTYSGEKTSVVVGMRYDYNTLYKQSLFTPRLHFKHDIFEFGTIRGSIGKAYRSPIPLAENLGLLASSRYLNFGNLGLEDAWNYGVNYVHNFFIGDDYRMITLSFDAYRTDFRNQLIVNLDRDAHAAYFYMSNKKSFANSLQLEARAEVLEDLWTLTLAGRYNDSRQTIDGKLRDKLYVSKWKFLMVNNLNFNNKWFFDLTSQYNGRVRLPNTNGARPDYSEPYPMFFAQLTKRFKKLDVYVGCENIFNTVQENPIIGYENPFGPTFDATVIYGSLMSRMFYVGLRLTL